MKYCEFGIHDKRFEMSFFSNKKYSKPTGRSLGLSKYKHAKIKSGGVPLFPTCKINYVIIKHNHVYMPLVYVKQNMLICNLFMSTYEILVSTCELCSMLT